MIKSSKFWVGVFLFALALAGLSQNAMAAKYLTIPACAFRPTNSDLDNNRTWFANEKELYVNHSVDGPYFAAPAYLPDGAKVKKVTVYLTDNGAGPDDEVRVYLHRHTNIIGTQVDMAYLCNHSSPALTHKSTRQAISDNTISYDTINNSVYGYTVYVWFIFDCTYRVKVHAVKIEYD